MEVLSVQKYLESGTIERLFIRSYSVLSWKVSNYGLKKNRQE